VQRPNEGQGLRDYRDMDAATKDLLKAAIAQFSLSGRGYDRILKVSRTIADLEDSEMIQLHRVTEAIKYRAFDRKLFGEERSNLPLILVLFKATL
jgi:magnesium chelatase family protein